MVLAAPPPAGPRLHPALCAPENVHSPESWGWGSGGRRLQGREGSGKPEVTRFGMVLGQACGAGGGRLAEAGGRPCSLMGTQERGGLQLTWKPTRPCFQPRCLESPEGTDQNQRHLHQRRCRPSPRTSQALSCVGTQGQERQISPVIRQRCREAGRAGEAGPQAAVPTVARGATGALGGSGGAWEHSRWWAEDATRGSPCRGKHLGWQGHRPPRAPFEG